VAKQKGGLVRNYFTPYRLRISKIKKADFPICFLMVRAKLLRASVATPTD